MQACWHEDPAGRPTFEQVLEDLNRIATLPEFQPPKPKTPPDAGAIAMTRLGKHGMPLGFRNPDPVYDPSLDPTSDPSSAASDEQTPLRPRLGTA